MKIEEIRKCGEGIEVKVNNNYYYFNIDNSTTIKNLKLKIKEEVEAQDTFNNDKFVELKEGLENTEI